MVSTDTPSLESDFDDIVRLFYPKFGDRDRSDLPRLRVDIENTEGGYRILAQGGNVEKSAAYQNGFPPQSLEYRRLLKMHAKNLLFDCLTLFTGVRPAWGSLTGIRPTRIGYRLMQAGTALHDVPERLQADYRVSAQNAELVAEIIKNQSPVVQKNYFGTADGVDLYIHIPVCPSRCYYCSFVSVTKAQCKDLDAYLAALGEEIRAAFSLIARNGLSLKSVYIGGGTPTVLTAAQLDRLLSFVDAGGKEFTVECGRPETVDRDKLSVLALHGVTRISVNPQTFCDETLRRIGREHTAADVEKAFLLSRNFPFSINMDLIAGLTGESAVVFSQSLRRAAALGPDNITVHTLCFKRGSTVQTKSIDITDGESAVEEMLAETRRILPQNGYIPYYLYRQKNMLGNLENIGYALPEKICVNNVNSMEELTACIACGAGAISKRQSSRGKIERCANPKFIEDYLARFQELCALKEAFFSEFAQSQKVTDTE